MNCSRTLLHTDITIDGETDVSFTEDVVKRFEAYGWHVLVVKDGDKYVDPRSPEASDYSCPTSSDLEAIHNAIVEAQKVKDKPTLIKVHTTIGYGSAKQGTESVHGSRKAALQFFSPEKPL